MTCCELAWPGPRRGAGGVVWRPLPARLMGGGSCRAEPCWRCRAAPGSRWLSSRGLRLSLSLTQPTASRLGSRQAGERYVGSARLRFFPASAARRPASGRARYALTGMPRWPSDPVRGHRRGRRPARRQAAVVTLRGTRSGGPRLITAPNADSGRRAPTQSPDVLARHRAGVARRLPATGESAMRSNRAARRRATVLDPRVLVSQRALGRPPPGEFV